MVRNSMNDLLLHMKKQLLVHNFNSFISASRRVIRELQKFKLLLDSI